jgi:nitroreductase
MSLSMGAMIQNLMLAATALKIGTQFISAPLERQGDCEQIRHLFNVPSDYEVVSLLRLGYVESICGRSVRLRPSAFVKHEHFN